MLLMYLSNDQDDQMTILLMLNPKTKKNKISLNNLNIYSNC